MSLNKEEVIEDLERIKFNLKDEFLELQDILRDIEDLMDISVRTKKYIQEAIDSLKEIK